MPCGQRVSVLATKTGPLVNKGLIVGVAPPASPRHPGIAPACPPAWRLHQAANPRSPRPQGVQQEEGKRGSVAGEVGGSEIANPGSPTRSSRPGLGLVPILEEDGEVARGRAEGQRARRARES